MTTSSRGIDRDNLRKATLTRDGAVHLVYVERQSPYWDVTLCGRSGVFAECNHAGEEMYCRSCQFILKSIPEAS